MSSTPRTTPSRATTPPRRRRFRERFIFERGGEWADPAVQAAVRLLYLVAGVSYYKTTAAPVIDLGYLATSSLERSFLIEYYTHGLGEFAYRNHIDLRDLRVTGPDRSEPPRPRTNPSGAGR